MSNLIEGGVLKRRTEACTTAVQICTESQVTEPKLVQSRVVIWVSEKAEMFKLFHAAYVPWFMSTI